MEYGRSNREPVLDEEDEDSDIPIPSQLVRDQIDPKDLQTATGDDCISDWARRNVGSIHVGKRLFQSGPKQSDPKRQKGKTKAPAKQVTSDASTDDDDGQCSPPYQESGDSSSAEDDGDDDDDGDGTVVVVMMMVMVMMLLLVVVVVVEFISQVYTCTFTQMYDVSNYMY
jgi:hypothetical protein